MESIVLVGGGGHAGVLVDLIVSSGAFTIAGIVDKNIEKRSIVHGFEVLGDDDALTDILDRGVRNACLAIGSVKQDKLRETAYGKIVRLGFRLPPLVHPAAIVARDVSLGDGAQIMAGAVVQRGVRIGSNTIINTGSIVDHDCVIGDHVHIGPGVVMSGHCMIGKGTFIGVGSTLIQGIRIEEDQFIRAGSVVTKNMIEETR